MTITLQPNQERAIEEAISSGAFRSVEEFIDAAIAHLPEISPAKGRLGSDRLEATLREIARFSSKIPPLPDEAFTRETLYRDHD